jgi:hypothetical protein
VRCKRPDVHMLTHIHALVWRVLYRHASVLGEARQLLLLLVCSFGLPDAARSVVPQHSYCQP